MKARRLFRRWQRRSTRWLVDATDLLRRCGTQGEAEQIHQLRVTLRRLRLMLRLGAHHLGRKTVGRFRAWAQQVSTAVGTLRDLDVTLDWLRLQPDCEAVIRHVQSRRDRAWNACRTRLAPLPKKPAMRRVRGKESHPVATALAELYQAAFERHHEQVCRDTARFFEFDAAARHAFRRTVRRLRYLRELGLSRRQQRTDRLLKHLIRLQEALGEHQNCIVARAVLARPTTSLQLRRLRRTLANETGHWKEEIQHELRTLSRPKGQFL